MITPNDIPQSALSKPLSRPRYLLLVQAGLSSGQYRFAREAVLDWLATYPGDLEAGWLYARALAAEKRLAQAVVVLDGLCKVDPEFVAAVETWLGVDAEIRAHPERVQPVLSPSHPAALSSPRLSGIPLQTYLFALTGQKTGGTTQEVWGSHLWMARQALQQGNLLQTENLVREALGADPPVALAAVTHLHYLEANPALTLQERRKFALRYYQRWPDCLAVMCYLADWSLESGDEATGVGLLHQVAARDLAGQVIRRLWGEAHPYRRLWPPTLEKTLRLPVPAEVATILGWNRLAQGEAQAGATPASAYPVAAVPAAGRESLVEEVAELEPAEILSPAEISQSTVTSEASDLSASLENTSAATKLYETGQPGSLEEPLRTKVYAEELRSVQEELERLAERLNAPGLTNLDGRQPVYVLFSVRSRLESVYGAQATTEIEGEMYRLARAIQSHLRWEAQVFFPDDPRQVDEMVSRPARPGDAWSLKLALVDLDAALAKRGQMIGALLIVGGPEIVPFHRLPNPVDDPDAEVLSDNPYGTRDENYFIPEWPVGRLPGGAGSEPGLLLSGLRRAAVQHAIREQGGPWYRRWANGLTGWFTRRKLGTLSSFGYSAAIWKRAAAAVYRSIGDPAKLLLSPPLGLNSLPQVERKRFFLRKASNQVPAPGGRLAYFNLHGVEDRAEWYGHRDPFDAGDGPDYPVALRPQDISPNGRRTTPPPQVVFSEACYGLYIPGKAISDAVSLRFLEAGALAIAGATCMAYGSIDTPLIAADLLGEAFWRNLLEGLPAGEALRQAKIALASEMHRRQGYLDGEDQKTLISFVLYGDPLARPDGRQLAPRSVRRSLRPLAQVKTVCDRVENGGQAVSPEVVAVVKQVVAQYLPGMEDAQVLVADERLNCSGRGHTCPTSQLGGSGGQPTGGKAPVPEAHTHRLVTLRKQVVRPDGVHPQLARLTLTEQGTLVKLVVSR